MNNLIFLNTQFLSISFEKYKILLYYFLHKFLEVKRKS